MPRRRPSTVVITCEHASQHVPRALRGLGLPRAVLRSHEGRDPGALPVAGALARALGAPLLAGKWSRLVADLNRSASAPRAVARTVASGPVPANARLGGAARAERLRRYWRP